MDLPQLLERDEVLDALSALVAGASDEGGRLVLVAGEAGIGKTSVVRQLAERWDHRAVVLVGACDPLDTPRPLSPLLDIGADASSGITGLVTGGVTGPELFAALVERISGTARPTILVVEDVHWADAATLDFLRYVGRRVERTNAVVVATYRDDELAVHEELRRLLGDLATRGDMVVRVSLETLSVDAVASLIEESGASGVTAEELHASTGGNPFYVTEVLSSGGEMPATVQDAVLARVLRLDPEARTVVEAVAVAPRSLDVADLDALVAGGGAAADRAIGAGVVVLDGAGLRFRHELARSAVERSLAPVRRAALHRGMIDLLVTQESTDLARIVHHAVAVGDDTLVQRFAAIAAEQAMERGAVREAVRFFELAVDEADDDRSRADLERLLADAFSTLDRQVEAVEHARTAEELYRSIGDDGSLAAVLTELARFNWLVGDLAGATAAVEEAVLLLEPDGDSPGLALALVRLGMTSMLQRQRGGAYQTGIEVLAMARRLGSTEMEVQAQLLLGTTDLVIGDPEQGIATLERTMQQLGDERMKLRFLGMLGSGGGEVRQYDRAEKWLEETIVVAARWDEDHRAAYSRGWLARIRFEQGRWDEAVELAEQVSSDWSVARIGPMTALGALGRTRVRRGDPAAEEVLRGSIDSAPDAELQHVWPALCGLAELRWLHGRSGEAVEILADAYARALTTDSVWAQGEIGFWMWRNGGIESPPPLAAEPFALQMRGEWQQAAERWHEIGCPYEEALALADGDADAMHRALEIMVALGARPAADKIRSRLRLMGGTAPRVRRASTLRHPAGLTSRQAEILDRIAVGKTNREIADELFISAKTVEHHVSAILGKLGVATRSEAVAASEHGGTAAET